MSATRGRRRVLALAGALAVAAATLAANGIAQQADASYLHTVSGFVVEKLPDGDKYSAGVSLYYYLGNGELQEAARARTDDTGVYSLSVLDGTYYLIAHPLDHDDYRGGGVQGEWYGDTPLQEAATPIEVHGSDVVLSDIALTPDHRVTGQVVDEAGQPVSQAVIETTGAGQVSPSLDFAGHTDTQGRFTLWFGAMYAFALHVGDGYDAFAPEWFLDQSRPQDATPIRALTDTVLPPIVVGPGGAVSGTVMGTDGHPARHVRVVLTSSATLREVAATTTDVTGYYVLESLSPGDYQVRFNDGLDYDDSEPVPVKVVQRATTPLDATLTRQPRPAGSGPLITGRVVDDAGRPARGVRVRAVNTDDPTDDPTQMETVGDDVTDPDGIYRIRPAGSAWVGKPVMLYADDQWGYDVYSHPWPNARRYDLASAFHPGVRHYQDATTLTVPATRLDVPDLRLEEQGGIAGHVLQPDGSAPSASHSAIVYAFDEEGESAAWAVVQTSGRYFLNELSPGSYRLWFGGDYDLENMSPFLPNWWSGGTDYATATPIAVASGHTVSGIDAEVVPREQTVTGRVVDPDGRPVTGVYVNTQKFPYEDVFYVSRPNTDRDGRFSFTLGAGQYKIRFGTGTEPRFRPLWYGGGTTYADAGVLTITEGEQYLDLGEIRASPYPTISGRVTGAAGQRLSRVRVQPYLPDGTPVGTGVSTVGDGSFLLRLPAGGDYRLGFIPPGSSVPTQWFHNATTFATATPVTVTDEQQVTGVDEQLIGPAPPTSPPPSPPTTSPPTTGGSAPLASVTGVTGTYQEKRRPRRSRAVLDIAVQLPGGSVGAGEVRVTERGRVVARVTLVNGHATVVVWHPKPRVHTYVVTYLGNAATSPSSTTVRVDTR